MSDYAPQLYKPDMTFKDLVFHKMPDWYGRGAVQALVEYPNKRMMSIVRHKFSYGYQKGLYEIGHIEDDNMVESSNILKMNGVGVKGHCDEEDITEMLGYFSRSY